MADGGNAILSEAELAAALAEVEQLAGGDRQIPSLDEAAAPATVLVPVPNLQPTALGDGSTAAPKAPPGPTASPPAQTATPRPAAVASPAATRSSPRTEPVAEAAAVQSSAGKSAAPPASGDVSPATPERRGTSLGRVLYIALDTLLDWINWPFLRLGEGTRALIGTLGAVTLVLSLLAMTVLPLLQPDRDPLGFLRRRPPADASAAAGEHAAPTVAEGGHGGGH